MNDYLVRRAITLDAQTYRCSGKGHEGRLRTNKAPWPSERMNVIDDIYDL